MLVYYYHSAAEERRVAMANNGFGVQGNAAPGAWSSGLCDCFDDVGGCKSSFNPTLLIIPAALLVVRELNWPRQSSL